MKKKIILIVSTVIFVAVLVMLSTFLNKKSENEYKLDSEIDVQILHVTAENFENEVLKSEKTVLIDFYADWCGPCKMLAPIIEEVARENNDIKVVKINIDEEEKLANDYNIISIPTVAVIRNGKETNRIIGLVEKDKILEILK